MRLKELYKTIADCSRLAGSRFLHHAVAEPVGTSRASTTYCLFMILCTVDTNLPNNTQDIIAQPLERISYAVTEIVDFLRN